jgi:hypothetical protein
VAAGAADFDAAAASVLPALDIPLGWDAIAGGGWLAAGGVELTATGAICVLLDGFRANNRTANTITRSAMIPNAA